MLFSTYLALAQTLSASPIHSTILPVRSPEPRQQVFYEPTQTVYGYLPYWTTSPAQLDFSGLSHVAYFGVELNADASLSYESRWHNDGPTLVSRAHAEGVKVHLCLISFSDSVNNVVLPSTSLRRQTIQNLKSLVEVYNADGINIDIEGMDASRREDLNDFIQELSVEIPEIVIATPAVDWSDAYDYATLSNYADLFIMGYDYHWSGGDPGPVDPLFGGSPWGQFALDWTVNDYLSLGVDPERIILGLPLYGRSWSTVDSSVPGTSTGSSSAVVMHEAIDIANVDGQLFDVVTESPYILYSNEQIWFPSVESVESRILWANDQDIQGVGFWALGYENGVDEFWAMMERTTVDEDIVDPDPDDTGDPTEPSSEPSSEASSETGNSAPIANAGLDQEVVIGSIINLDGRLSSDPDGDSLTYAWTLLDPQDQEIEDAQADIATFAPTSDGIWEIALTVSDGNATSTDEMVVTVLPEDNTKSGCSSSGAHTPLWLLTLHSLILIRRKFEL